MKWVGVERANEEESGRRGEAERGEGGRTKGKDGGGGGGGGGREKVHVGIAGSKRWGEEGVESKEEERGGGEREGKNGGGRKRGRGVDTTTTLKMVHIHNWSRFQATWYNKVSTVQ